MSNDIFATHRSASSDDAYQYLESGLDNVWLKGGFERRSSPYGDAVFINDSDDLHRCIADCLLEKPGLLTGAEFRFLRTELDLSQVAMGGLCGVAERTIRHWELGSEPVAEPSNTIIRFVYRQRHDPQASFEDVSKVIRELQARDKASFEMRLEQTANGWAPQCLPMRRRA